MIDLIKLSVNITDCLDIMIKINLWFMLLVVSIGMIIPFLKYKFNGTKLGTVELEGAELGIGTSKIKLKVNREDIQIAYKLWIELSTRKIGLPIDYENDVIIEIYKSWYEFFGITRELIKAIPVTKVRQCSSTKDLVDIAISVLNSGLRTHLTLWQAKFRHWYEFELNKVENQNICPQELQKKYPEYDGLIANMKSVNDSLIIYRENLKKIVFVENKNIKS